MTPGNASSNSPRKSVADASALEQRQLQPRSRWARSLYLLLAGLFFVLSVLGIFIPGLPATPFLLLTSYFLVRSSPRLNAMLLRSRWFGPMLVDWQVHGGVRPHVRVKAILAVTVAVGLTLYFSNPPLWFGLLVVASALVGIVVVLNLPSARPALGKPDIVDEEAQDSEA